MATSTSFGWELPDDTDLVKDGAAAMRTLGNAIDASMTELRGGTTGQILSKTSNTDMDFTWTADTSGGATLISTTTLTGGSVTLSSISSSYTNLRVVIRNYKPSNDNGFIYFRVNGDAGANRYQLNTWTTTNGAKTFGADAWILANNNDNSVANGYLEINFPDYANTVTWKTINGYGYSTDPSTTTSAYYNSFTGAFNQTGAISSMEFINSGGNFTSGTVLLYGVK